MCVLFQLMKELREGLILGMTHRERFHKHINTALEDAPEPLEKYNKILREYDATVREVLAVSNDAVFFFDFFLNQHYTLSFSFT